MVPHNYNRIKELLARKGSRNLDLANYMEIKDRTVSKWCTNSHQPSIENLYKISDYFGVEVSELLTPKAQLKPIEKKNKKKTETGEPASPQTKAKLDTTKPNKKNG